MERWNIVVVGAGASGLMAAQKAAAARKRRGRTGGVLLVDGNGKPGRKLLATGNGRCNLTNWDLSPQRYHGDVAQGASLLEAYPPGRILEEFAAVGLLCREDGEGRVYPRNLQAAAVLQTLWTACQEAGVSFRGEWGVEKIVPEQGGFCLENRDGAALWTAQCILACGGKASPKHSWEGGGYGLARSLGHTVTDLRPSLTYLKTGKKALRSLKGMRVKARTTLRKGGKPEYEESGEVLFGEGTLSGICLFNLSARLPEPVTPGWEVSLDLLEDMDYRQILTYLENVVRDHPQRKARELFAGVINLRVGEFLARELEITESACFQDLTRIQLRRGAGLVKDWRFPITGRGDWSAAQVTAGGVPLSQVDPLTLESRKRPGLFMTGELLNLDGDCGGYNLHWAWATGLAAGQAAGERKEREAC